MDGEIDGECRAAVVYILVLAAHYLAVVVVVVALQYVMYFPPGKKYVALFVGEEDDVTVKSRTRLMDLAKKNREVSCHMSALPC